MDKITEFLKEKDTYIAEERDKMLIGLGLCEKEYEPEDCYTEEYCIQELTPSGMRYYKYVPIEVTDSQWDEIVQKMKQVEDIKYIKNKFTYNHNEFNPDKIEKEGKSIVASMVSTMAWIVSIIICIGSLVMLDSYDSFMPLIVAIVLSVEIVLGTRCITSILNYLSEITYMIRNSYNKK